MRDKKLLGQLESLFSSAPPVIPDGREQDEPPPVVLPRLTGWTWETDAQGAFTFCSAEAQAALGYQPEELTGRTLLSLLSGDQPAALQTWQSSLQHGRPLTDLRLKIRHANGQTVETVWHGLPLQDELNRPTGQRGVAHLLDSQPAPSDPEPQHPAAASVPERQPPAPSDPKPQHPAAASIPERQRPAPSDPEPHRPAASPAPATIPEWRAYLQKFGPRGLSYLAQANQLTPADDFNSPDPRELAVPIRLQDHTLGVLNFFDENETRAWSNDERALVQAVSEQLALALENARLFDATRDQLSKRTLLYEVTRAAASAASLGEALQSATQALARVLPDSNVAILLLDDDGRRLRMRASVGFPAALTDQLEIPLGNGITGAVAESNQPILLRDVRQDARYLSAHSGTRSELAVPLALGERVIGVLNAESPRLGAYDESDLQLLSTLAGTLSAIIFNNRLIEQITRERERLSLLYDVLQTLTQGLDINALMQAILAFAPRLGAQHGYVLILGDNEAHIQLQTSLPGLDRLDTLSARQLARALTRQGLERWVIDNRRSAIVSDTRLDQRWHLPPSMISDEPARSVISAPLRTQRGAITGALAFTHSLPGQLTAEQALLVESIAAQVAVALENAQLSAQRRIQQHNAEVLAHTTQAMTRSALDEAQLTQSLADELFAAYLPDSVLVARWDQRDDSLQPVAFRAGETIQLEPLRAVVPTAQRPHLQETLRGRHGAIRLLGTRADGALTESLAYPLTYGGEVEGVVEIIRTGAPNTPGFQPDDLDLLQGALVAMASALQTARLYAIQRETAERLAEVDRLKSQFLANMSHELRTPLNSIIGFSRVILKGIDGPLTDLQSQDLTSIYNAGQHLLGLINNILDLSKIEAGKMELVFEEVELRDIIKSVLSTAIGLVRDKPVQLYEEIEPDLPTVRADSMRIRQILLNLVSNASKFTDEGRITVRARTVRAPNPLSDEMETCAEISVQDTGHGIASEDMHKLFEPFSQVDASATRKTGGTGLGLNICRHLVELHNGRIWVESQVGQGSTFIFTLPLNQPEVQDPLPDEAPAGSSERLILAIDDDQGILQLYRRYLQPHGFQLMAISRSSEAVAKAEAVQPLAILLDVLMPGLDGWQVLEALKQNERTRHLPVLMCTIASDPERARQMGAVEYLNKPILEADLVRALSRVLARAAAPARPGV